MAAKFNLPPDTLARLEMLSKHTGSTVTESKRKDEAVARKSDASKKGARPVNGSEKA
jgi:hypothetical protein